jgi:hypothetical protein
MQIENCAHGGAIIRNDEDEAILVTPLVVALKVAKGAMRCGYCDKKLSGFALRAATETFEIECPACLRRLSALELGVGVGDL